MAYLNVVGIEQGSSQSVREAVLKEVLDLAGLEDACAVTVSAFFFRACTLESPQLRTWTEKAVDKVAEAARLFITNHQFSSPGAARSSLCHCCWLFQCIINIFRHLNTLSNDTECEYVCWALTGSLGLTGRHA